MLIPTAHAHQPRITESSQTIITEPEISKAYYGQLKGTPDEYIINSTTDFDLYVNILIPDNTETENLPKDVSATIYKTSNGQEELLSTLDATTHTWTKFFEPFGQSSYWEGPEYKAPATAGTYKIIVQSPNNDRKYSLATGEIEAFNQQETINAITTIPQLKQNFFNESPATFIFSPIGWGYILIMYLLAFVVGFIYRAILKKFAKSKPRKRHKNLGTKDRLIRLALSIILLIWAITTTWNPILLFFSGFTLFEAIFSWCGLYAVIGKNSCPL